MGVKNTLKLEALRLSSILHHLPQLRRHVDMAKRPVGTFGDLAVNQANELHRFLRQKGVQGE